MKDGSHQSRSRFLILAGVLLLSLASCRQEKKAEAIPPEAQAFLYAFTSGVISKTDPIKIQFSVPAVDEDRTGQRDSRTLIRFSPDIKGDFVWEDSRTLRFEPAEPLPSGSAFVATVNLKMILPEVPRAAHTFQFDFQTKAQFFEVDLKGLYAAVPGGPGFQELHGTVFTADYAEEARVAKMLTARQDGQPLAISWYHSPEGRLHSFTVQDIRRGEASSEVFLHWNGKSIDVDRAGDRTVEVPALGDFRVINTRIEYDPAPGIVAVFSDPLQESQVLDGLVAIQGYEGQLRFLIDGQELRIFPDQRLAGDITLRFSPGIRNSDGRRMTRSGEWNITLLDAKPQVRLVGRGVIMPDSEGLVFPFEAIGLTAVDIEILKIFNSNILQFLQSNQLDGNYALREVGRIIMQRRIDLNVLNPKASSSEWTRYALDLKNLISEDPEAIYQVRIGFRRAYTTYSCGAQQVPAGEALYSERPRPDPFGSENGDITSIMDSWYGLDGYYEGYMWEQREDPCYPAYYNSDRFVARNIMASNLGLIAKGGDDGNFFVVVTDLRSTQPAQGASVEFYDYQQQLIRKVTTDAGGMAEADLHRKPFVAIARQGNQNGYLRLQDGDALSLSRFDVDGALVQKGLKGFLYAERGVWRPGDSVFLHFILDDRPAKLPANYPINFELYDPRGNLQERRSSARQVNNLYPLYFATSPDAPTGTWTARVNAGGATFEKRIRVETVKPNRLSIDLDFGADALHRAQEPISAGLEVKWLHGAPARGIRAEVEVSLHPSTAPFDKFPAFVFQDPTRQASYTDRKIFDGTLDKEGRARFSAQLFSGEEAPGPMESIFRTRAYEPGGDFSTDYLSTAYHPYQAYVGLLLPQNEFGEKWINVNAENPLELLVVDPASNPLPDREVEVKIYRVDWQWWWERGHDDISRYNSGSQFNAIETGKSLITNAQGRASWSNTFKEWGRYLVRVCDQESGHCSADFLYVGYPGYGESESARQAAAMLNFRADKEVYEVGETVTLTIPTGKEGRALITLENGTKVLRSFWTEANEGENTFSFKTDEEMMPTVYAHVTLIQPHAQVANDLPIRLYGIIPIKVEDPATVLMPKLTMPGELAPEQTFGIEVAEKDGKPMAYTVFLVDEGLLSLTRFPTPNPHQAIYARQALGVHTWDVYDQVLGAYGDQLERMLSVGGDAALRPVDGGRANRFDPVVRHLGPFYLEKGKKNKHQLTLPNYVGAVRAMVVAAGNGAYGAAEKSVPVKQPLMVLATLPRQLSPGERVKLPVTVFAMDKKVKNVEVKVEENNGMIRWLGTNAKKISFDQPGEDQLSFEFQVTERTGIARFSVLANGDGTRAAQSVEIAIRNPNPMETRILAEVLDPNKEWEATFEAVGMEGTNEAILEISSIPPLNLGEHLEFLLGYPYGCVEQTVSSGFPQLYVHRLLNLDEQQKRRAADNVQATLNRLRQFQTSQGGFAYWPGQGAPDQWSSNYAGHFLLEARQLGYTLPAGLFDRWMDFQKKAARMWSPRLSEYGYSQPESNQLNQAYRLYTMALAGQADMAAMNRLRESDDLTIQTRWRLAAAYALTGQNDAARNLVENVSANVADYRELSYTFGSGTRDRAMILESLLLMGEDEKAAQLLQHLSDELSAGQWMNTQTVAYALLAVSKYVGDGQMEEHFQFAYQLHNGQAVNAGSGNPVMQVEVPVNINAGNKVWVKNNAASKLFARLIVRGKPLTGNETSAGNGLDMEITYLGGNGKALNPESLIQGTDFIAEVRITHPGDRPIPYQELALSQIFPSGWEIINTRFTEEPGTLQANTSFDYQDIRDDRVDYFFDLPIGKSVVFRIRLNAAYEGRFYLPAASCEAMYDNSIFARQRGRWVEVLDRENI